MSGITSDCVKSKLPDASSTRCTDRLKEIAEHWFETANDEFGFGVIYGLRLAIEIVEGSK